MKRKVQEHRVRIDGRLVHFADATKDVTLDRSLVDVWNGKRGVAGSCMNARCILRNQRRFPHKVLAVSVVKSRVYVFDKADHVVRYNLSKKDRALIAQHDETGDAQPGKLRLLAISHHERKNGRPGAPKNRALPPGPRRKKAKLARGEKARLLAAVGATP